MSTYRPLAAFSLSAAIPVLIALALLALFAFPSQCPAAQSATQLQKKISQEKNRAAERRKNLQRLTEQERKVNSALADAEKRVLELERGIEQHQAKLLELSQADDTVRKEYELLLAEQAKTEKAQAEALRLLWDITTRRIAVGSRDMADWAGPDREYAWSRELYAALEGYRKALDTREAKLVQLLGRREKLSLDIQKRLEAVNDEKARLLQNRIAYDRQLAELRREKVSTEAELRQIMKLVESLNFEVSQLAPEDIAKLKGRLPWPVNGKMRLRYAPSATPAVRGLGFSAADKAEVRAVAGGKIVHNDILRGFGTVLIVQHSAEYFSLYAFLGSSPLKVGSEVRGNQRLGTVGFYPAIKGPGLYFELRYKQKAINPEQWFSS